MGNEVSLLLAMNEGMADNIQSAIDMVPGNLVVCNTIDNANNLKRAVLQQNPGVVLMQFDHLLNSAKDNANDIISTIQSIMLHSVDDVRFAIIIYGTTLNSEILTNLVYLGVKDIFVQQMGEGLPIKDMLIQLSEPANNKNVNALRQKYPPRQQLNNSIPPEIPNDPAPEIPLEKPIVNKKTKVVKTSTGNKQTQDRDQTKTPKRVDVKRATVSSAKEQEPKPFTPVPKKKKVAVVKESKLKKEKTRELIPVSNVYEKQNSGHHSLMRFDVKKLLKGALILVPVILMFALFTSWPTVTQAVSENVKPSYDSLMEKKEYEKAADKYPKNVNKTETQVLSDADLSPEKIKSILGKKEFDTADTIEFDRDFLDKNYSDAYQVLKNQNFPRMNGLHAQMASYSCLVDGDFDNSEKYAEMAKDNDLKDKAIELKKISDKNSEYKKALKEKDLSKKDRNKLDRAIKQQDKILNEVRKNG
ncbi:hypothetical protein JOC36_001527 [Weissella uvarum]|uniref:hypothetical protein n=1 Tax=Weissella uvarum TaxID=1479233 RepID=UPI00196189F2|nr:hypothetical protein [Weissella uvarum]MBM7617934.1 hypothetical protein [Weissella uvarum]MCM0596070.1 hypothetical protein [Weissella uvarum]